MSSENRAVTAQVAPVKEGKTTSSFKLSSLAVLLIPLIPVVLQFLEQYVGTLPENSVPAVVLGIVIVVAQYLYTRYRTTDGERQAQAKVAQAQAVAATVSTPSKVEKINERVDQAQAIADIIASTLARENAQGTHSFASDEAENDSIIETIEDDVPSSFDLMPERERADAHN